MADWTDEYREIVEFYWWEPQVLGRSLNNYHRFSSADDMWASVSRKEVALNHILNIFFALMPLERLSVFGFNEGARSLSSAELENYQRLQKNVTQPDLFVVEAARNSAIELKTNTKSSLEQLQKYVSFHMAIEPSVKPLRIIMLTPYMQEMVFKNDISSFNGATIEYVGLRELCDFLENYAPSNNIENKLVAGLLKYIQRYFNM